MRYTTHHKRVGRQNRGSVLILVAICALVLIGFVGLSIDYGKVYYVAHQLQNGADASALAGALLVKTDEDAARTQAITVADKNKAWNLPITVTTDRINNDPTKDVVLGRWISMGRYFVPTDLSPNAVKVSTRRLESLGGARPPVPLSFGPIFGVDTADVERVAIARSLGDVGAGIITLAADPTIYPDWHNGGTGFVAGGKSGTIDLSGYDMITGEPLVGDMQINATSTDSPWNAFRANGGPDIIASSINVVGDTNPSSDDQAAWEAMYATEPFDVRVDAPHVEDPLDSINDNPPLKTLTDHLNAVINDKYVKDNGVLVDDEYILTLEPGYYPGGIDISSSSSKIVLQGRGTDSGEFESSEAEFSFGGGNDGKSGLVVNGGSLVEGDPGVLIYVTGEEPSVKYGKIDIGGNANIKLTSRGDALDPKDYTKLSGEMGVVLWQDKTNPNLATIIGSGTFEMLGTLYLGYNPTKIGGDSETFGSQIIAGALELDGGIDVAIGYDGRNRNEVDKVELVY